MCKKISVLIPSYRPESYIESCLKSLDLQSLDKDDFTVYIALNGSDKKHEDYLKSILRDFSFSSELFFIEKPGVSNARNYLIDVSKEPFVCFLDDDDIISENYLQSLLKVSSRTCIGISNVKIFTEDVDVSEYNYIGRSYLNLDNKVTSLFLARKYFSSPCAKMMHRRMIGDNRFDLNLDKGEDGLFMANVSASVSCLQKGDPEAVYYVYARAGSATRKEVRIVKELKRILYLILKYSRLMFDNRFDKFFIISRIIATALQFKKLFK